MEDRVRANQVDMRAVIIGDVEFGSGNTIGPGAIIVGPTFIGDDNFFGPNCVVGLPPQDDGEAPSLRREGLLAGEGTLQIGSGNTVREFATVHRGLTGATIIADGCYLMAYSNVQHDCVLGGRVKLANSVQMGGYSWLGRGVYLGLSAVLHQFTVVGAHSMVGMGSVVTRREVPPGSLLHGNPARLKRPNRTALESLGVAGTGWWDALIAGDLTAEVPPELREDMAAFRAACAAAEVSREEVSRWRAARAATREG